MADSEDADEKKKSKKKKKEKEKDEGGDEGKKKKKDKKKAKDDHLAGGGSTESLDSLTLGGEGGSIASLDGGSSKELSPRSADGDDLSPRPDSVAVSSPRAGEGGEETEKSKKKKKDKKEKKSKGDRGGDADDDSPRDDDDGKKKKKKKDKNKGSADEPTVDPEAAETPRTVERKIENAITEELKGLGLTVLDRQLEESSPLASPATAAPLDIPVPVTTPAVPLVESISDTEQPLSALTESVSRSALLADDSVDQSKMSTEELGPPSAISIPEPSVSANNEVNAEEGAAKRRRNSFKGKQPPAEFVAAMEFGKQTELPVTDLAVGTRPPPVEDSRLKEAEEAKARSLKLRADARARRTSEVAARKDAENERLKSLEAAAKSVLNIQTILAESDEEGTGETPSQVQQKQMMGAINPKKYPITASRGIMGVSVEGEVSPVKALKAHPPLEVPPPSFLIRPTPGKGVEAAKGPATSPKGSASSHFSEILHSRPHTIVDPQLDYHVLQVNAMVDDLNTAAAAAAAAATAIAARASAMQSPREHSSPPHHDRYHPLSTSSTLNPLLVSPKAIKFKLPEDDPLLNYSPSKLKTSASSSSPLKMSRNSFEKLPQENTPRTLPLLAERNTSAESKEKKRKPLWQRLQEQQQHKDAEAERQRGEAYIRYKIERAKAQPTKEEIAEHMRQHDMMFEHKSFSKFGGEKRILKGGVNNDPLDLIYKKSDYLAAEDRILTEARSNKLKRQEDRDSASGSPLRTKTNARAIDAIERRKDEEFLASEEKRLRLSRKKEFSKQVRESFLPSTMGSGLRYGDDDSDTTIRSRYDSGRGHHHLETTGASQQIRDVSHTLDAPLQQFRRVNKQTVAALKGKNPASPTRSIKAGSEWVAQILESDKEEKQLADVYEVAFSSFFS